MRRASFLVFTALAATLLGAAVPAAGDEAARLKAARAEAEGARGRSERFDAAARDARSAAERARAEAEALAARIEAAEAELTAAEARIALIERLQVEQRARLAERQAPLVRLTGALQTMARRPSALALVQPGSVSDTVHVRSLLAATLPEIRRRTAALRAEVDRGEALRREAEGARARLGEVRGELAARREALARFEAGQRARSEELAGLALVQSDRALAFGEEARALAATLGTRQQQQALAARLARLPGPEQRPGSGSGDAVRPLLPYSLPAAGRLLTGVGEISDAGVHARGLLFETAPEAAVVAPAAGRILYARPFRSYGHVVIIDHGAGLATVLTDLAAIEVAEGAAIARGQRVGRTAARTPRLGVELRREGRALPVAQLVAP